MSLSPELKKIKKIYGENFMKLCRDLFPTILEQEGLLTEILLSSFSNNSRSLSEDIKNNNLRAEFKDFIYIKFDEMRRNEEIEKGESQPKNPYELLDEAGYNLYECTNEGEIQSFKKYYEKEEELCTFNGGRLDKCVCFFAVKKNVDEIKRENFSNPQREDEYGTSVMGIQFIKEGICTVSIKNRYNHTVINPDATYGNNLDRIIPGLEDSFKNLLSERGLNFEASNKEEFSLPGYTVANDGRYYKYNVEINGIYYCPGNIVIENGEAKEIASPEKQILMEYFVIDLEKKEIRLYDKKYKDSFVDGLKDIEKIDIKKDEEKIGNRIITIQQKGQENPVIIKINEENQIVEYKNENLKEIQDSFLGWNKSIESIELPNVKKIGIGFLSLNKLLNNINLSNVEKIGNWFLWTNNSLSKLELPNVKKIEDYFLMNNNSLSNIDLPNVEKIGNNFLMNNKSLSNIEFPNVKKVGDNFLDNNELLTNIELPNVEEIGDCFLSRNKSLSNIELQKVKEIGTYFLSFNESLSNIELPNVEKIGRGFLIRNKSLSSIELHNVKEISGGFLSDNISLSRIELPNVEKIGNDFLMNNKSLTNISLPKVEKIGDSFLYSNKLLTSIDLPKVNIIGEYFLHKNKSLRRNIKREGISITSTDIAVLDMDQGLTVSEVNLGKNIIGKIRDLFKNQNNGER